MLKFNGKLNLSAIPKELIFTDGKGNKCIYVDVVKNKGGADQYGHTHTITVYDKNNKKPVYLANLKSLEYGNKQDQAAAPAATRDDGEDLPF